MNYPEASKSRIQQFVIFCNLLILANLLIIGDGSLLVAKILQAIIVTIALAYIGPKYIIIFGLSLAIAISIKLDGFIVIPFIFLGIVSFATCRKVINLVVITCAYILFSNLNLSPFYQLDWIFDFCYNGFYKNLGMDLQHTTDISGKHILIFTSICYLCRYIKTKEYVMLVASLLILPICIYLFTLHSNAVLNTKHVSLFQVLLLLLIIPVSHLKRFCFSKENINTQTV